MKTRASIATAFGVLLSVCATSENLRAARLVTFSNPAGILIADNAPASLYPSAITASGIKGSIAQVTVTVSGINHAFPDDIDMLLQSPSGTSVALMSDVGASLDLVDVNLTFADGEFGLPDNGPVVSGTFSPSNFGATPDNFPAPAPAEPSAGGFAAFDGENPNGSWSLYIRDDLVTDPGSITGGWSLSLLIDEPPIVKFLGKKKITATSQRVVIEGAAADDLSGVSKVFVKVNGGPFKPAKAAVPFWKIRGKLKPGTNTISVFATDGAGNASAVIKQKIVLRK